ncbi:MAG: putative lipid II flippase FtsW [Christensenellales bacterium]
MKKGVNTLTRYIGNYSLKKTKKVEIVLIVCTSFLALFGLLMQYSAGSYVALRDTGDAFYFVKKQALALVLAVVGMIAASKLKLKILDKFSWLWLALSCVLLALVFIPGLGVEKYGATRWINLGFTTFQPSEIAKFAVAIFIASRVSKKSAVSFRSMLVSLLAMGVVCVLIMLEPNMSITMCVGLSCLIILFAGGAKMKHFAILAIPLVAAVVVLILIEPYRLKRLMAFVDPWASPLGEGYQLIQSYYALGNGGLFGVGMFNSRQKYLFLPFAESDFIFAIICEELGWAGGVAIIGVYCAVIVCGIRIAINANTRFNTYLCLAITVIIAVQTLLNIAVVTGSIPPTGLPLPFVSYGGSSLVVFMSAVGLMLNVSRQSQESIFSHKMY